MNNIVNALHNVRAQLKQLKLEEEALAGQLKALGVGEYEGAGCKAVVYSYETSSVDVKAMRIANPTLVAKFTRFYDSVAVKIK